MTRTAGTKELRTRMQGQASCERTGGEYSWYRKAWSEQSGQNCRIKQSGWDWKERKRRQNMTARTEQLGSNNRGRTTSGRTAMTVHSRQDICYVTKGVKTGQVGPTGQPRKEMSA
jgi:hypothetical protein